MADDKPEDQRTPEEVFADAAAEQKAKQERDKIVHGIDPPAGLAGSPPEAETHNGEPNHQSRDSRSSIRRVFDFFFGTSGRTSATFGGIGLVIIVVGALSWPLGDDGPDNAVETIEQLPMWVSKPAPLAEGALDEDQADKPPDFTFEESINDLTSIYSIDRAFDEASNIDGDTAIFVGKAISSRAMDYPGEDVLGTRYYEREIRLVGRDPSKDMYVAVSGDAGIPTKGSVLAIKGSLAAAGSTKLTSGGTQNTTYVLAGGSSAVQEFYDRASVGDIGSRALRDAVLRTFRVSLRDRADS